MSDHACQKCYGRGVIPTRLAGEGETDYRKRCRAAGESEALPSLGLSLAVLNEAFNAPDSAERLANMDVPRVLRAATDDFGRIRADVTRLQDELSQSNAAHEAAAQHQLSLNTQIFNLEAERDDLKARCIRRVEDIQLQAQRHEQTKSELTKARELIDTLSQVGAKVAGFPVRHLRESRLFLDQRSAPAVAHKTMREEVGASVEDRPILKAWLETKEAAPAARGSRETVDLNLREPSFYRNRDND